MNYYDKIKDSKNISENDKYYWGYMYNLAKEYIVNYLIENEAFYPGMNVCEIGCAEGGVLAAFIEAGANNALGTDIAENRLEIGRNINREIGIDFELSSHNILFDSINPKYLENYDLVILRDVIEHLADTDKALKAIYKLLKPGGKLYVTFPPYYSAYGGHQHTLANTIGKMPFLHYLPKSVLKALIKSGRELDQAEVMNLKEIVLTPNKFENSAKKCGYLIDKEEFYIIRPVYKMKFGLPAIKSTSIKSIPMVKNILSMEAGYILKKGE
jgi:2-polyprenyl-3-methyl-5-hydroxy-6-metoxy-1,4-benzoquinol methylase